MGPAYVGGQFGYSSGDPNDTTKDKSGPVSTTSWVPALFFANANLRSWQFNASQVGGANGASFSTDKQNLWLWNAFAGFNPTPKLNTEVRLSYMYLDKKPNTLGFRQTRMGSRPHGDLQDLRQLDLHGGRGVSLDRRLLQRDQRLPTRSETTTS